MKIFSILTALILIFSITSCGTMPGMSVGMAKREAAKLRPAYQKFQKLCKGKNLPTLNKPIQMKGYLTASTYGLDCDFDGWGSVVQGKLAFFECSEEPITSYDQLQEGIIYRFDLIHKKNGQCPVHEPISDNYVDEYSNEISERYCLIKKRVNKPKSKYAKVSEWGYINGNNEAILSMNNKQTENIIAFRGYSIVDVGSGHLLSVLNRKYTYTPDAEENHLNFECKYQGPDDISDMIGDK